MVGKPQKSRPNEVAVALSDGMSRDLLDTSRTQKGAPTNLPQQSHSIRRNQDGKADSGAASASSGVGGGSSP